MSSSFGQALRVTVFGQSHSEGVGVVLDGLPAGEKIDLDEVRAFLSRRAPGGRLATPRKETDEPRILGGLVNGLTCGAPLCAVMDNADTRSADYEQLRDLPRPMHADYPAQVKYGGYQDVRGGGHFSARLTLPLCFAGAVCIQLLKRRGVTVGAHLLRIGEATDEPLSPTGVTREQLLSLPTRPLPVLRPSAAEAMPREIELARQQGDSVGGIIECAAVGLPVGLGEPPFGGVENRLSAALFAIPAVKGVEYGAGFMAARLRGSEHNDAYRMRESRVVTETNRHGGILGGLTTGMPLLLRVAMKPTPSIAREQRTVSLKGGCNAALLIRGRHDPCVALRAVPCVESAVAVTMLDLMLEGKSHEPR